MSPGLIAVFWSSKLRKILKKSAPPRWSQDFSMNLPAYIDTRASKTGDKYKNTISIARGLCILYHFTVYNHQLEPKTPDNFKNIISGVRNLKVLPWIFMLISEFGGQKLVIMVKTPSPEGGSVCFNIKFWVIINDWRSKIGDNQPEYPFFGHQSVLFRTFNPEIWAFLKKLKPEVWCSEFFLILLMLLYDFFIFCLH